MRSHAPHKAMKADKAAVDYFRNMLEYDIGPYTLKDTLEQSPDTVCVVDVRSAESYAQGHIPGAISVPFADLPGKFASLPKDKTIVTSCGDITCLASAKAALELAQKGFKVQHLLGGFDEWKKKGYPVDSAETPVERIVDEGGPME
jgi:rhodanese-related sulfurtransferase